MTDNRGALSIDFLAGFTIFMLAFIWVISMISGIFVGLQANTIDYEAVAYRSGVILVEDAGWPSSPPWEFYGDGQKFEISRFGLAFAKDTPGILSQDKINRFFCTSFIYPDDYDSRAIFGNDQYHFNISFTDTGYQAGKSVGDVLPEGYGYIRRLVKIKSDSNATIDSAYMMAHNYNQTGTNTTENIKHHEFSILINNSKLQSDQKNPTYQIDPTREQITINITELQSTIFRGDNTVGDVKVRLASIKVYKIEGTTLSMVRTFDTPYIDGSSTPATPPCMVTDNISLIINPRLFDIMQLGYSRVYLNLSFDMLDSTGTPTTGNLVNCSFLNNSFASPFDYNYNPANVTQPWLRDGIVEVAVW
jgi:hypothetical protein